jgi:hypothetical protein
VAIKKDRFSALRSRYSAFAGGKALIGNVGDSVGPQPTGNKPANNFKQANFRGVSGKKAK